MNRQNQRGIFSLTVCVCAVLIAGMSHSAFAATLCVSPRASGCYSTIGNAVAAAQPGDVIEVAQGVYNEDVVIGKSLTLNGKNPANTIIDASGLANGIYVDGLDNPGLKQVTIAGFTVRSANFEGILVTNASGVTLEGNHVTGNDRGLNAVEMSCPGLPDFETSEGLDCGEGVHVIGINNSLLVNNLIENNSGGILVSDETAATHDNVITGNAVLNNTLDCGITIPSHPPAPSSGSATPFGIYRNTVTNNVVSGNGVSGEGAGIGLFAFLPGGRVSDNFIFGNIITNNGLPGVAFHAHAPGENFNNNVIVSNYIAGNGEDTADAATPGPTGINIYGFDPIYGTVLTQNVIKGEAVDIAFHIAALPTAAPSPELEAHFNNLNSGVGVDNLGVVGSVNATDNWWGCSRGPNMPGCSSVSGPNVQFTPWLSSPAVPNGSPNAQQ